MINKIKITEKEIEFLKEYEKLCKKYNIFIGGCGCCGSPFIELSSGDYLSDLGFDKKLFISEFTIDETIEKYCEVIKWKK